MSEPCARCGHDHGYWDTETGHQPGPMIECYDCGCPGYRTKAQQEAWVVLQRQLPCVDLKAQIAIEELMELYP